MKEVRKKLIAVVTDIRKIDGSIEKLDWKLQKFNGISGLVKSNEKQRVLFKKEDLQEQRTVLSKQIGRIVHDAGYHDAKSFMEAYRKSEDTVRNYHDWLEKHPEEKKLAMESALDRLHRYQLESRIEKTGDRQGNERIDMER